MSTLGAAISLAAALQAPAAEPAPAPVPLEEPAPSWDEVLAEPAAPTPTPTPAITPPPQPTVRPPTPDVTQSPWREEIERSRRAGNGLLIGGGVALGIGTLLNVARIVLVTGVCQSESQYGCSGGWFAASFGGWAANLTGIGVTGLGGAMRGRADASDRAPRHRVLRPRLIGVGGALIGLGVLANIAVRGMWLDDYDSPGGVVFFDFARPSDAIAYYGTLQLSSFAIAAGITSIAYATADPLVTPPVAVTPMIGGRTAGLQVGGRF